MKLILIVGVLMLVGACRSRVETNSAVESSVDNGYDEKVGNPSHYKGPFVVEGPFYFNPEVVADRYVKKTMEGKKIPGAKAVDPERFGTTKICRAPATKPILIRDLHYHLGNGRIGIHPIPVHDRKGSSQSYDEQKEEWVLDLNTPYFQYDSEHLAYSVKNEIAGQTRYKTWGSNDMDRFLRLRSGFSEDDEKSPIFAITVFQHPEQHEFNLTELFAANLKFENGLTHMGAYIGKGMTRNAPYMYEERKWGNRGYPVNLSIVRLAGVPQDVLNQNLLVSLNILNEVNNGPVFPTGEYRFDEFKSINLEETLAFFRGWVDKNWKRQPGDANPYWKTLQEDPTFRTYCAEHIVIAVNVGLNLPQNREGYRAVWPADENGNGKPDGDELFDLARARYLEALKTEMPDVPSFNPLWKKYPNIVDPAHHNEFAQALAFPPIVSADLLAAYIENYLNFTDVGPTVSTAFIFGALQEITNRMKIKPVDYLVAAREPIARIFKHYLTMTSHAGVTGSTKLAAQIADKKVKLYAVAKGFQYKLKNTIEELPDISETVVKPVIEYLNSAETKAWIMETTKDGALTAEQAWANFREDVRDSMSKARTMEVGTFFPSTTPEDEHKFVKYYSPPGIIHRIQTGIHPSDPNVTIQTVATAFDEDELVHTDRNETVIADPSAGLGLCNIPTYADIMQGIGFGD